MKKKLIVLVLICGVGLALFLLFVFFKKQQRAQMQEEPGVVTQEIVDTRYKKLPQIAAPPLIALSGTLIDISGPLIRIQLQAASTGEPTVITLTPDTRQMVEIYNNETGISSVSPADPSVQFPKGTRVSVTMERDSKKPLQVTYHLDETPAPLPKTKP